jgi:hypothetical protein
MRGMEGSRSAAAAAAVDALGENIACILDNRRYWHVPGMCTPKQQRQQQLAAGYHLSPADTASVSRVNCLSSTQHRQLHASKTLMIMCTYLLHAFCVLQVLLYLGRAMWCATNARQAAAHPGSSTSSSSQTAASTGECCRPCQCCCTMQ